LEIDLIRDAVYSIDKDTKIILFGSRIDKRKKGGDIDLLIISDKIDYRKRRRIKVTLFKKLGDRKIDLIVTDNPNSTPFTKMTYKNGVQL
jgi:predicted nucleotidyltransferase